jgi:hypothetical protein
MYGNMGRTILLYKSQNGIGASKEKTVITATDEKRASGL